MERPDDKKRFCNLISALNITTVPQRNFRQEKMQQNTNICPIERNNNNNIHFAFTTAQKPAVTLLDSSHFSNDLPF